MKKRRVVPGIVCGIVGLTFAGGGTGPLLVGCSSDPNREAGQDEELFEPDIPVGEPGSLFDGHPGNETLPDDNKADAVYPAKFAGPAEWDSPVKNQGKRSICSIFATTALMENLYRKSGILNDPDFSEQYLQWSVKYEMDRFADSPGSNFAVNLETIAKNGIVTEDVLPYEDRQWGTSNDPACTGQEGP
ncbi:MAG: hypothetical protein MUF54_09000, partial [Polyangiaceae bacterium]|nr:hypothetical protein [Polyangiaceae bacterium]